MSTQITPVAITVRVIHAGHVLESFGSGGVSSGTTPSLSVR